MKSLLDIYGRNGKDLWSLKLKRRKKFKWMRVKGMWIGSVWKGSAWLVLVGAIPVKLSALHPIAPFLSNQPCKGRLATCVHLHVNKLFLELMFDCVHQKKKNQEGSKTDPRIFFLAGRRCWRRIVRNYFIAKAKDVARSRVADYNLLCLFYRTQVSVSLGSGLWLWVPVSVSILLQDLVETLLIRLWLMMIPIQ